VKSHILQTLLSTFAIALLATSAHAAPTVTAVKKEPVQIKLEQFKVSVENGKETLTPIQTVKPGEVIEYRATYKNVSTGAVKNIVATIPVPKSTEYQAKTANPLATVEASIDNVTFAAVPLMDAAKKTTNTYQRISRFALETTRISCRQIYYCFSAYES